MTQTCRPGLALLQAPRRGMCMGCVSEVLRRAGNHCSGPALRRAGLRARMGEALHHLRGHYSQGKRIGVIENGPRWETGKQVNPLATMTRFI